MYVLEYKCKLFPSISKRTSNPSTSDKQPSWNYLRVVVSMVGDSPWYFIKNPSVLDNVTFILLFTGYNAFPLAKWTTIRHLVNLTGCCPFPILSQQTDAVSRTYWPSTWDWGEGCQCGWIYPLRFHRISSCLRSISWVLCLLLVNWITVGHLVNPIRWYLIITETAIFQSVIFLQLIQLLKEN